MDFSFLPVKDQVMSIAPILSFSSYTKYNSHAHPSHPCLQCFLQLQVRFHPDQAPFQVCHLIAPIQWFMSHGIVSSKGLIKGICYGDPWPTYSAFGNPSSCRAFKFVFFNSENSNNSE